MGRHGSGDASLDNGQEEGHALGDACYGPCLVMGTSLSRIPLGFQQYSRYTSLNETKYIQGCFDNVNHIIPVTIFIVMLYNACFTYQEDKSYILLISAWIDLIWALWLMTTR